MKLSNLHQITDWAARAKRTGYNVSKLACDCCCSTRQLERYFAQHLGANPNRWARELRFIRACVGLTTGLSVEEVASNVGYHSAAQFCRDFKKLCGLSPRQYATSDPDGITTESLTSPSGGVKHPVRDQPQGGTLDSTRTFLP